MIKIYLLAKSNYKFLFHDLNNLYSTLFFFLLLTSLFPIAIGPDLFILSKISIGLMWIIFLFIIMNTSKDLFQKEIYFYQISIYSSRIFHFSKFLVGKWISFWLFFIFPTILSVPFFFFFLGTMTSFIQIAQILVILILSTLSISYLSLITSVALIVLKKNDLFISFFFIPLYFPVFIFSSDSLNSILVKSFNFYPFFFLIFLFIFSLFLVNFVLIKSITDIYFKQ